MCVSLEISGIRVFGLNNFKALGTILAKITIYSMDFRIHSHRNAHFLMLCLHMVHLFSAAQDYLQTINLSNSLGFYCHYRRLHIVA